MDKKEYLKQYYQKNKERLQAKQRRYHREHYIPTGPQRSNATTKLLGRFNPVTISGDAAIIYVGTNKVIIDLDNVAFAYRGRIHINKTGYATNAEGMLHRQVFKATQYQMIDHVNQNTLDNRKSNLRIATKQLNSLNSTRTRPTKIGQLPVGVHKNRKGKFEAYIQINGKKICLGSHHTIEQALTARIDYEQKHLPGIIYREESRHEPTSNKDQPTTTGVAQ